MNEMTFKAGTTAAKLTMTHNANYGSFAISDNGGHVYLQKSGSTSSGSSPDSAYLQFPNVGTSSTPKTLATTDLISSAEFIEAGYQVTITLNESGVNNRTSLTIIDGTGVGDPLLYTATSGTSVGSVTVTVTSGNLYIDATTNMLIQASGLTRTGGVGTPTTSGNYSNHYTISVPITDNGTCACDIAYNYD